MGDFEKALHNFTMDAAAGDAIRHLTDLGYGPSKIRDTLSYPATMEYIGKTMYEHLLNNSVILLEDPATAKVPEPYEYVLERNEFGKTSFRRVPRASLNDAACEKQAGNRAAISRGNTISPEDYCEVEFGAIKYHNAGKLNEWKGDFDPEAWDYLMNIPWPLQKIWHRKDARVEKIMSATN